MAEIRNAFAVPLVMNTLEGSDSLNRELEALFRSRSAIAGQENPQPIVDRNAALYESRFQLFDSPETCVQRLRDFCWSTLYGAIGELNGYDTATLQRLHMESESWYHLTQQGGYFGVHNHALHAWSGVYCVRHDGDDPRSNSGRLTFVHPNATAAMYMDMSLWRLPPPFSFAPLSLRLEPGQLVIFPSWLLHHVTPYEGNTVRITVAFNCRFSMVGETAP